MTRRKGDAEADKYGWKAGGASTEKVLKEKNQAYAFNRWAIKQKLIPK